MKRKSEIYKRDGKLYFKNIIKRNFTSNTPCPKDNSQAIKLLLDNVVNPLPILEGLKREIPISISNAEENNQPQLVLCLKDLEEDLNITLAAYEREEYGFVAFKMFHLGRTVEIINAQPAMKTAISYANRADKSGSATAAKYAYFSELAELFVNQESNSEWHKRGFKERTAKNLCNYLSENTEERLKAGLKNDYPSIEACRRKVQQAIDKLSSNTTG